MATRFHTATSTRALPRTVPNLPGALVRRLSEQLAISPTVAMRVALLYGDIEWQAAGLLQLRYSASDYARRMGFHRNTVHGDLQRLRTLGAIAISSDRANTITLQLLGLHLATGSTASLAEAGSNPCPPEQQPPCRSEQQPLVAVVSNPLLLRAATLEKPSKNQEKEDRKKKRSTLARSSGIQGQAEGQPGRVQSPEAGSSRGQEDQGAGVAGGAGAQAKATASPPEPRTQGPAEPKGMDPTAGPGADALLDRLLDAFRAAAPPEWPAPERLTPSRERRSRLRQALEHAGSLDALEARLRAALGAVPAWFRHTYPVRPDGSRRPAYQFFDLLLRASAAERDCGVEAWHLFAWSEGARLQSRPHANEPLLERAQRLLRWDSDHQMWSCRGAEALRLPLAERRQLAQQLEAEGLGVAGTGARQFAEPEAPSPGSAAALLSSPEPPMAQGS
jgi:hypothetical protein